MPSRISSPRVLLNGHGFKVRRISAAPVATEVIPDQWRGGLAGQNMVRLDLSRLVRHLPVAVCVNATKPLIAAIRAAWINVAPETRKDTLAALAIRGLA